MIRANIVKIEKCGHISCEADFKSYSDAIMESDHGIRNIKNIPPHLLQDTLYIKHACILTMYYTHPWRMLWWAASNKPCFIEIDWQIRHVLISATYQQLELWWLREEHKGFSSKRQQLQKWPWYLWSFHLLSMHLLNQIEWCTWIMMPNNDRTDFQHPHNSNWINYIDRVLPPPFLTNVTLQDLNKTTNAAVLMILNLAT